MAERRLSVVRDDEGVAAAITPPSGTVTFLFTDVEGSSALWADDAEAMAASLRLHDEIVRSGVEAHGGYVFTTAGDSFAVAFDRASLAVAAAAALQQDLESARWSGPALRVRLGLHLGEAEERGGDYYGQVVNTAARVEAAGHGGQVLMTAQVREAAGVDGRSLGRHALRGIGQEVEIFQLGTDEFPPLRTEAIGGGNLPTPAEDLVGRAGDVAEVVALARRAGIVTVLGPGGMGKTRLALEAAAALRDEGVDGGWFVDLASASGSEAVVHLAIEALEVHPAEGEDLHAAVVRHLAQRSAVVVLDNCEHVLDGAAQLAEAILAGAPEVDLLATSRERLDVGGEQVWPLSGLPPEGAALDLFVQRARALDPGFELRDASTVMELCRQLDGMPLAIELAAARAGAMTPEEIVKHLGDRFRVLRSSGRRGRAERGASALREMVDWSYRLLDEDARLLMVRLSVFPAAFTTDDAVAVCAGRGLDRLDAMDIVTELVEKSLLVADRSGPVTRYRMLETIRAFGHEVLDETGTHEEFRRSFAAHVSDWLGGVLVGLETSEDAEAATELDRGWADLREAVNWAIGAGDVDLAVNLVAGLGYEAQLRERREAREWLWRVADMDGAHEHSRAAELLAAASIMDWVVGDFDTGYDRWQQVEAIRSERDAPVNVQVVLAASQHCSYRGEHERTQRTLNELLDEARDAGHLLSQASVLMTFGISSAMTGQTDAATDCARQLTALTQQLDNSYISIAAGFVEMLSLLDSDPDRAAVVAQSAIAMAENTRMRWWVNSASNYLTWALVQTDRPDEARAILIDLLEDFARGSAIQALSNTARSVIALLAQEHRREDAAVVCGWLDAQTAVNPGTPGMRELTAQTAKQLSDELGPDAYEAAASRGGRMSPDQLIAHIHTLLNRHTPPPPATN